MSECSETSLTPAEAIRSKYYLSYENKTLQEDGNTTLYEPEIGMEPKIVLDSEDQKNHAIKRNSSKLLLKLSKSTAPMRAKLSTLSPSKSQLDHLWASSSSTLTRPIRKSAEGVNQLSLYRKNRQQSKNERSQSFSFDRHKSSTTTITCTYPALLSKVAESFKESMVVGNRSKNSIVYHDVFDGRDAVDKLASIIRTTDRDLALLVGRALDHQRYFHDVNYEHRLRDSDTELYQFKSIAELPKKKLIGLKKEPKAIGLPNGIFTALTRCYSPTCTASNACYSLSCPKKHQEDTGIIEEGQLKLARSVSQNSLTMEKREDRLWLHTVPKLISSKVSSQERCRQENIFELIYTEQDFVNDLNYVEKYWISTLKDNDYIPKERRDQFIKDLFWNLSEVRKTNELLVQDLLLYQSKHPLIDQIGHILLKHVWSFEPFVTYGEHQCIGKHTLETEKSINPAFAKLVEHIERLPESRKLELNGYLTKPTTRLGRYNLLLKEILKNTPRNHPDHESLPQVIEKIKQFLACVNEKSGHTENRFSLQILNERLSDPSVDCPQKGLDLLAEHRRIILKGKLKKGPNNTSESSEIHVYVLDHCLLLIKSKYCDQVEKYKLYRKPIPLALLLTSVPDQNKRLSSILPYSLSNGSDTMFPSPSYSTSSVGSNSQKTRYPICFNHLGRNGSGPLTLCASTLASQKKWLDTIESHKRSHAQEVLLFDTVEVSSQFFSTFFKVNCAASYQKFLFIGCDHGIYFNSIEIEQKDDFKRALYMNKVSQIDILEDLNIILILADKVLYSCCLNTLLLQDTLINEAKTASKANPTELSLKKISSNVSFFKTGKVCDKTTFADRLVERTFICFVKYNAMTSTIRVLEPKTSTMDVKKKKTNKSTGVFTNVGTADGLYLFKDLYMPGEATSIQFFKNVICVGSAKGFQMVDIGSANVQSVLDPNDESHYFIKQREALRPISMFKCPNGNILLCYNDRKGRRINPDWMICWEGQPSSFAFHYPYILAFDPTFVEIRHSDTGKLIQVIPGNNIRCLQPNGNLDTTIYCAKEDEQRTGSEIIFGIKNKH
ncbi:CNH domain-containing protein [Sporodiniella umbellata]|nr:CNH domain-containing protein [Sporodiniella umbellata]